MSLVIKNVETLYQFTNKESGNTHGLYKVETLDGTKYFVRNADSVGVIAHLVGRPASECVLIIRTDVKQDFFKLVQP